MRIVNVNVVHLFLITLVSYSLLSTLSMSDANAQNEADMCLSPLEFRFVSEQDGGRIFCGASDLYDSLEEAQDAVDDGEAACTASNGDFFGSADAEFISGGGNTGRFLASSNCSIEYDISDYIFCPSDFLINAFFNEVERSDELLKCGVRVFGQTISEAQDRVDDLLGVCSSTPDSTSNSGEVEEFFGSGFTSFSASVTCDISLVLEPEFGPFGDGVVIRACDATCTEEIEETRVCLNGNVGDPGCEGSTTRTVTSSCNTGSDGLCPVMPNVVVPSTIIPLILEE